MPIVNIALRVPSASGVDVPAVGTLDFKPVARRTVGDTIVLPRPFRVSLVSGNATVSLAATGADWFWQVTENTQQRYQRSVAVPLLPNPVGYEDLVDVDPKTFAPDTSPVPGWVVSVPIAVDEWLTENPPPAGPPNTLTVGTVTTVAPGGIATASVTGTAPNQTLNLGIPEGDKGDTGPANTLTIGTVTEGATPAASITGAAPNQTLDLTLKTGAPGPANTLAIGTVVEGPVADAVISGTAPNQVLDLTLKTGDAGPPNSLTIGTVQDGAVPAASITGTPPNQVLDLTLKAGAAGPPNTLAIGTVSSGATPAASITGTPPNQVLDLTLKTGDAGPPNTLTAGTVTKIPAGGQPTVSITGTAPNQTLNLGLVDGSPTAFELRGGGFPGTGSNATATDAAAVGSIYTDVLGTIGAFRWIKTSAGTGTAKWRVQYGDTGIRDVRGLLINGWQGSVFRVLRRHDMLLLQFDWIRSGSTNQIATLPSGYRPLVDSNLYVRTGNAFSNLTVRTTGVVEKSALDGSPSGGSAPWLICPSETVWPTTLPGLPG